MIKPLSVSHYLTPTQIQEHLEGIEYIIMVEPSVLQEEALPLHFVIVLNTACLIPDVVQGKIFEKMCRDYGVVAHAHLLNQLEKVAFAMTSQETPMPAVLRDPQQAAQIPWQWLHVIDFVGDSDQFPQAKDQGLSGWSYIKN